MLSKVLYKLATPNVQLVSLGNTDVSTKKIFFPRPAAATDTCAGAACGHPAPDDLQGPPPHGVCGRDGHPQQGAPVLRLGPAAPPLPRSGEVLWGRGFFSESLNPPGGMMGGCLGGGILGILGPKGSGVAVGNGLVPKVTNMANLAWCRSAGTGI